MARGDADVISDVYTGPKFLAQNNLVATKPYHDPPVMLAGLDKAVPGSGIRVGATREMLAVGAAYLAAYPTDQILYFSTASECEDAHRRRVIDAYIPRYPGMAVYTDELQTMPFVSRGRYSMALGLSEKISPLALSVLDKAISTLTASEIDAMQMSRTDPSIPELLLRLIREYAPAFILLIAIALILLTLRVIKVNRRYMMALAEAAYRDPLTGGDNRAKFLLDANTCLKNARKTYYLVLVNLRRLKLINRTRSHAVGDMLIKLCHEELLRHSQGPGELVGHAAAGKFLLLWQCNDDLDFRSRIEGFFASAVKLRRALDRAVVFSCGAYAIRHYDGQMANCLLLAETAESSLAGEDYLSRYALYDAAMEARLLRDNELENRMVQALRDGEFAVYVQPQVCLSDNSLYGAEALINIPPQLIEVEITESMSLQDEAQFKESLAALRRYGIFLALDDFGKGYASLSVLQSFDVDVIKMDKTFLDNATRDTDATRVIIESVVGMGKRLQLTMLCEGIETEHQLEYLRNIGCDLGQGYFIAKPMPLEEYSHYVTAYPGSGEKTCQRDPS